MPEAWIDASLSPHVTVEGNLQYGFQWWLLSNSQGGAITWAAAFGNGGQRAWVVPGEDLVVVITAGLYDSSKANTMIRDMFRNYILAAVR